MCVCVCICVCVCVIESSGCGGTHHVFDDLILAVLSLDFEQVVAEVEKVKATLLSQQHDDGAAGPVQPVPKALPGRQGTHNTQVVSIKVGTIKLQRQFPTTTFMQIFSRKCDKIA